MIEDETADRLVEAAELVQQLAAALRVQLHLGVLAVVQRGGLLQDRLGNGQLADVVEQAADREAAQAVGREAQLLADLDCKCRDATCVLLRRGVLRAEPNHECPHAGAEERLFRRHELRRAQVTDQRARAASAAKVVHERGADDEDAEQLEDVAEQPAEVHEREDQGAVEPRGEENDAEHDREVPARRVSRNVFIARVARAP